MSATPLYPLRFEPLYQYRPWGGRRLAAVLSAPLPKDDTIGEAWVLSDRDDNVSVVADGPLKGQTLSQLLARFPEQLLGKLAGHFRRFPLLLKFLDVRDRLSVQVHPAGDGGKTEAWIVLETGPAALVFAGLKTPLCADEFRQAIADGTVAKRLAYFTPKSGDAVFIEAGTVHSLSDAVVFEVQQNSDVTLRIYDWERIDSKTGQRRPLQVEQAMACIDFERGAIAPIVPRVEQTQPVLREELVQCEHFGVMRIGGQSSFVVGAMQLPSVLVCLDGDGLLEYAGEKYPFIKGDVLLLPAAVGRCRCRPRCAVSLLEISLPQGQ